MKRQMELFSADIVAFPIWRRADLVRSTADTLEALPTDQHHQWWTEHCLALADGIRARGKSEGDIAGDLQRYANAVANELHWRHDQQQGREQHRGQRHADGLYSDVARFVCGADTC